MAHSRTAAGTRRRAGSTCSSACARLFSIRSHISSRSDSSAISAGATANQRRIDAHDQPVLQAPSSSAPARVRGKGAMRARVLHQFHAAQHALAAHLAHHAVLASAPPAWRPGTRPAAGPCVQLLLDDLVDDRDAHRARPAGSPRTCGRGRIGCRLPAGPRRPRAMSSRAIIAPIGITPLDRPLPQQMMSGVTPKVCAANMEPVLPNPVMTSSKISITLCRCRSRAGSGSTPPWA